MIYAKIQVQVKAEQEWKEAIDAEKEAEQALAVAVLAKEDARLSMVAAEKELQDVQTVRTKIEEEGGNDVRSAKNIKFRGASRCFKVLQGARSSSKIRKICNFYKHFNTFNNINKQFELLWSCSRCTKQLENTKNIKFELHRLLWRR